jgi:hypothetical protein
MLVLDALFDHIQQISSNVEIIGILVKFAQFRQLMSELGLGCVKTKSDLVVMPSGRQIFPFFCPPHHHRAQNSGCGYTA